MQSGRIERKPLWLDKKSSATDYCLEWPAYRGPGKSKNRRIAGRRQPASYKGSGKSKNRRTASDVISGHAIGQGIFWLPKVGGTVEYSGRCHVAPQSRPYGLCYVLNVFQVFLMWCGHICPLNCTSCRPPARLACFHLYQPKETTIFDTSLKQSILCITLLVQQEPSNQTTF